MNEFLNIKKSNQKPKRETPKKTYQRNNRKPIEVDGILLMIIILIISVGISLIVPKNLFFKEISNVDPSYYASIADTIYYEGLDDVYDAKELNISFKLNEKKVIISPMYNYYLTFDYSSGTRISTDNSETYIGHSRILVFGAIWIPFTILFGLAIGILKEVNLITLVNHKSHDY